MNQDTRDLITWTLGTLVSLMILVAAATKFVLLPWLKDHLVQPVQDTHHQVTANSHSSAVLTIPDRLEDLADKVDEATAAHDMQARDLKALANVLDQHLRWSDRWVDVVDRELDLLKRQRENGADK